MLLMDGAVIAMLSALAILSALGLFAPLRMLAAPVFRDGVEAHLGRIRRLPRWIARTFDADVMDMMFAVAFVIPFFFIMPWLGAYTGFWASLAPWRPLKRP